MSQNRNTHISCGGGGFTGLLTIVFITLKLIGYIDWSWWWVLSPLWIGFLLNVLIVGIFFVIALVIAFLED